MARSSSTRGRSPAKTPRSRKGRAALRKASSSPSSASPTKAATRLPPSSSKKAKKKPSPARSRSRSRPRSSKKKKEESAPPAVPLPPPPSPPSQLFPFSATTFIYELLSCFFLFLSFPIPVILFPGSPALQYAAHAFTVMANDFLTGGLLSPPVAFLLYYLPPPFGASLPLPTLTSTLLAQALAASTAYGLKSLIYPPSLIFGPACTSTLAACFVSETYLTALLTAWCMIPPTMLAPKGLRPWVARAWIAAGIRVCMTLDGGLTGASMNPMIAAAYYLGGGDLGEGWFTIYIWGPVAGATLGAVLAGVLNGGLKKKVKEQ
mmetsp:Transcript_1495/g.2704  ORF Transcript_1495/g.2704 Transcript_1495/m.2704 type:complete len:320 (-) Transcript_1495:163-1122(-)